MRDWNQTDSSLSDHITEERLVEISKTDSTFAEQNVILVDAATLREAERLIASCEHCNPDAEISFDYILDHITGSDPTVTDYILKQPARCPNCRRNIFEKTLIEPE